MLNLQHCSEHDLKRSIKHVGSSASLQSKLVSNLSVKEDLYLHLQYIVYVYIYMYLGGEPEQLEGRESSPFYKFVYVNIYIYVYTRI